MPRFLSVVALCAMAVASFAQSAPQSLIDSLSWREVGPFRGGRSVAVSGVPGKPKEFYMGTTGGGLWKSLDEGQSWANITDGFFKTGTVGGIAVAPSQTDTVYVGMGEHALRGNITHGDGVYRTDDGGKTWRHLGLEKTQYIGRVHVHPTNPEVAWIAAIGPVFRSSPDRGIYKTTDGGKSWKKTLFISDKAGANDLTFAPQNPSVMMAATWEVNRTPYSLNSGGPGSGMHLSTDGGETWKNISDRPGLPMQPWGKVGVSISAADPNRVYAMIEARAGGLYRSDDGGETWEAVNRGSGIQQRPWYYFRVYADPTEKDTVYVLNVLYYRSSDGGKTLAPSSAMHSDHHDMWIDPADNNRLIMGNDGGATVSVNRGRTWTEQDFATAQMYHVSVDNAFPYNILGAQQDNSTVRLPSRTRFAGIRLEDWTSTAGGESGYVVAKPDDPDIVLGGSYGGLLEMENHRTRIGRSIEAWPENPMGDGVAPMTHRFQWTFPIVFSKHDPNVFYVGSQHVLRSKDLGASYDVISPDLTTNDKSKQQSSGGIITQDNTSVEYYCTVFTIAESPLKQGTLWAGTDDGNIQVTTNEGKSWRNVTPSSSTGNPGGLLISMIDASPHAAQTAWVAANNYKNGDQKPYIFVTRDNGKTWQSWSSGLPEDCIVRVVREDPVIPNMVYAGTEHGLYVKFPSGPWQRLGGKFPEVPVHDFVFKGNDLVVGTHGRSFWVMEELHLLRQLRDMPATPALRLLNPKPANPARFGPVGAGTKIVEPVGENPALNGIVVEFLVDKPRDITIKIKDGDANELAGVVVKQAKPGLNRVALNPSYPGYKSFANLRMWSGFGGPLKAPPGQYSVTLETEGEMTLAAMVQWQKHPLTPASEADLREQFRFSKQIADRVTAAHEGVVRARGWKAALASLPTDRKEIAEQAEKIAARLTMIEDALHQGKAESGQDFLNHPIRLNNKLAALLGVVQGGEFGPTKQSYDVFNHLDRQLDTQLGALRRIEDEEITRLQTLLKQLGIPALAPKFEELRPGRGGFMPSGEEAFPGFDGQEAA